MGEQPGLFKKVTAFLGEPARLPGWFIMVVGGYSFIPDTASRLDFWLTFVESPTVAAYLASPWIGVALIAIAVIYLWHFRGVVHVNRGILASSTAPSSSLAPEVVVRNRSPLSIGSDHLDYEHLGVGTALGIHITNNSDRSVFDIRAKLSHIRNLDTQLNTVPDGSLLTWPEKQRQFDLAPRETARLRFAVSMSRYHLKSRIMSEKAAEKIVFGPFSGSDPGDIMERGQFQLSFNVFARDLEPVSQEYYLDLRTSDSIAFMPWETHLKRVTTT